jgi:tetratricopeptide (TPR) repeat protein
MTRLLAPGEATTLRAARLLTSGAVLCALLSSTRPVRADDAPTAGHGATLAEPSDAKASAARARALELFERSSALYDVGDFSGAVELLERAYAEFPEPVLLYNLGRTHEGLGDYAAAIAAYEKYLVVAPDAKDRGAVTRRVATLHARADELHRCAPASTAPPSPPAPAVSASGNVRERPPSALRQAAPWIVTGVGALTLASGGVLSALAADQHDLAVADPDVVSSQKAQRSADDLARGATIAFVVGGVLTAVGATWGIVTLASAARQASAGQRYELAIGLDSVALSGAF